MVHSPRKIWVIGAALVMIGGYLLEREIYFYEGVYFGPRLQAWLYDRWSKNYDEGKPASQLIDEEMLAQLLLESLHDVPEHFVLDFARSARFAGRNLRLPGRESY